MMKKSKIKKNFQKKILIGLVIIILIFSLVYFFNFNKNFNKVVKRSLSNSIVSPEEEIKLTLSINIKKDKKFYIIEEKVPEGFKILDYQSKDNKIKIFNMEDVLGDKKYEYTLISPQEEGIYYFEGEYALEGYEEPMKIGGKNKIIVKNKS